MTDDNLKPIRIMAHKHPLTDDQRATLNMLCDLMIPASKDGVMPAASSLNLYDDLSELSDEDVQTFADGLYALQEHAQSTFKQSYHALTPNDAQSVFDALRPELRRFASLFTVQTAARYYAHDTVMPLIGLEPRAPWPQGNTVKQGDWSLLDPVRRRAPMYRQPG